MDIWKQLEIAGNTLVGKTVDGTKISRLESKVEEIEKEIQVGCRKLGAYIIEKDLQIGDEEAVRKIRDIRAAQDQIRELKGQIEKIKARVNCPACGTSCDAGDTFCRKCGAPLSAEVMRNAAESSGEEDEAKA